MNLKHLNNKQKYLNEAPDAQLQRDLDVYYNPKFSFLMESPPFFFDGSVLTEKDINLEIKKRKFKKKLENVLK